MPPPSAARHRRATTAASEPVDDAGHVPRPEPARTRSGDDTVFVGSVEEDDGSVTIMLRGRFGAEDTARVGRHVDLALRQGARFLVVEAIGTLAAGRDLRALLGRTQSRLAARRGLLVLRGVHPDAFDVP